MGQFIPITTFGRSLVAAADASAARTVLGLGSAAVLASTAILLVANNLSDLNNASTARTNLGLGSIATQASSNVAITGGSIGGINDLAVADGGTGASTASAARTNLGGTTVGDAFFTLSNPSAIRFPRINADNTVTARTAAELLSDISAQASDATLTAFAALTIAAESLTIGTGADAFTQTTFAANTFPARASTGSLVAKTITDFGLSLVDDTAASNARTTLGLGTAATANTGTSGSTLPFLNTANTWSAAQTISKTDQSTLLSLLGNSQRYLNFNPDRDLGYATIQANHDGGLTVTTVNTAESGYTAMVYQGSTVTFKVGTTSGFTSANAISCTYSSGAKVGFLGATAVAVQSVGGAATDAATTQTLANNLRTALINFGLCTT